MCRRAGQHPVYPVCIWSCFPGLASSMSPMATPSTSSVPQKTVLQFKVSQSFDSEDALVEGRLEDAGPNVPMIVIVIRMGILLIVIAIVIGAAEGGPEDAGPTAAGRPAGRMPEMFKAVFADPRFERTSQWNAKDSESTRCA